MKHKLFLLACICMLFVQCKKDSNGTNSSDLTSEIVGNYTSGSGSGQVDIVVTKINNNTISVTVDPAARRTSTHANTTMASATTFTLNPTTETQGDYKFDFTGSGSYSANNIVVVRRETVTEISSGLILEHAEHTYTASK